MSLGFWCDLCQGEGGLTWHANAALLTDSNMNLPYNRAYWA